MSMKYAPAKKIKMATWHRGKKRDKEYDEFFKEEVDAVLSGAKKPDILPSIIKRKNPI